MNINELEFGPHSAEINATHATVFFDNGYGASVITGASFYTRSDAPYELAVLKGDKENAELCYDTPITNDVLGYLTAYDVEKVLDDIAALKAI